MRHRMLPSVLFALGVGSVQADPNAFYFGAGVTRNNLGNLGVYINPEDPRAFDINDATSWKALAGFRPISPVAIEADYIGAVARTVNRGDGFATRERVSAIAGYGVGFLPLGKLPADIFAKAGFNSWRMNSSGLLPPGVVSESGTGFAWGIGLQAHVGRIGARVEYEKVEISRTDGLQVFSLVAILSLF